MNNRPTVAGVILTLNEERDLPRALSSLMWCDEILVLDSGSTDQTQSIAADFGANFVCHIPQPPFLITEQRNWALKNCGLKSDWVLFLDADEEVSEALAYELVSLTTNPLSHTAYELTPRYWFFGKWLKRTQGYPNWHPRFLKRSTTHFIGGVWESFAIPRSAVGQVLTPYEHYAFSKGLDDWLTRHARYSSWEADHLVNYLRDHDATKLGTSRSLLLRIIASKFWPCRPLLVFFQKYVLQLGFLEGWQSLLYVLMISFYHLMIVIKTLYILGYEKPPATPIKTK